RRGAVEIVVVSPEPYMTYQPFLPEAAAGSISPRHVLDAARDVFGEQGYEAPVEEVARRARVGVGTVYRRFPNKEALVRYVTELETRRLVERALSSLSEPTEPWTALEGFVRFASSARSGRLLPELFAVGVGLGMPPRPAEAAGGDATGEFAPGGPVGGGDAGAGTAAERVPQPRTAPEELDGVPPAVRVAPPGSAGRSPEESLPEHTGELLELLHRLVERARLAGQLRSDASVADVLLVIATAPPPVADAARQAMLSERLLDILLQGLRPART
ncbi:helix-turn-helix domain-containing protein, partial [Streptomyces bohaiensis]